MRMTKEFLIKEYIKNKKTGQQTGNLIGCSKSTISKYLKKYNIKTRNHKEANKGIYKYNISKEFLLDEYINNKKPTTQIAKIVGCSWATIRNRMIEYNILIRTKSEAGKGKNNPNFGKRGKDSSNYIDGRSSEIYPSEYTSYLRKKIRERDNFECQECDMTEEEHLSVYGRVLDIHHIDYNKQNCNENNLITLCHQCNLRANYNRKYWKNYYQEIIYVKNYA